MKEDNLYSELNIVEDDNDKLKNQILDLERESSDVLSNYERDKALWKEKFEFLDHQKKL